MPYIYCLYVNNTTVTKFRAPSALATTASTTPPQCNTVADNTFFGTGTVSEAACLSITSDVIAQLPWAIHFPQR